MMAGVISTIILSAWRATRESPGTRPSRRSTCIRAHPSTPPSRFKGRCRAPRRTGSPSAEELTEPRLVKADNALAVDDGHGSGHEPHLLKVFKGRGILADVPLLEGNATLRKKLFRLVAEESARLGVDDDLLGHSPSFSSSDLRFGDYHPERLPPCWPSFGLTVALKPVSETAAAIASGLVRAESKVTSASALSRLTS